MQQASRLSRSFFLQHCTCPAVAPLNGVQLAYRVWRKPLYVAGRYLKLLRGVAQVCCAPLTDTTGQEQRTPCGERPPEAALDTTTCLIAPDPSSPCAVSEDPTFGATSAVSGLWLDCVFAPTVLAHQLCTCCTSVIFVFRIASKDHVLCHQSETGSKVRKPRRCGQLSLGGVQHCAATLYVHPHLVSLFGGSPQSRQQPTMQACVCH